MGGTTETTYDAFGYAEAGTEYSAKMARRAILQPYGGEGLITAGDFAVSERAAGANMSVDVAAGEALVQGDTSTVQGLYYVYEDSTLNVTLTAADGSNPRNDLVVLEIKDDDEDSSGVYKAQVRVVDGTATAGASLANLTGAPAVPDSCLPLAYVNVPASDTTISDSQIAQAAYAAFSPGRTVFLWDGAGTAYSEVTSEYQSGSTASFANSSTLLFDGFEIVGDGVHDIEVECYVPAVRRYSGTDGTWQMNMQDADGGPASISTPNTRTDGASENDGPWIARGKLAAFSGKKEIEVIMRNQGAGTAEIRCNCATTNPIWIRARYLDE